MVIAEHSQSDGAIATNKFPHTLPQKKYEHIDDPTKSVDFVGNNIIDFLGIEMLDCSKSITDYFRDGTKINHAIINYAIVTDYKRSPFS